jgi:ArsR family transcriptional regulator, virulence genes transcriptional regulator
MPKLRFEHRSVFLTAIANEQRLKVLEMLSKGEVAVMELSERIGISQSALSQHLAKLRVAKMVTTRREAQTIFYSVTSPEVRKILETLEGIFERSDLVPEQQVAGKLRSRR